jgi:hypothetical protein
VILVEVEDNDIDTLLDSAGRKDIIPDYLPNGHD